MTYTLLRLVLLAASFGVLYLLGLRDLPLAVGAIVVAALISYLVLPRQAGAAAGLVAKRSQARKERRSQRQSRMAELIEDDAAQEDALFEAEDGGEATSREATSHEASSREASSGGEAEEGSEPGCSGESPGQTESKD